MSSKPKSYKGRRNSKAKKFTPKHRLQRQSLYDSEWRNYRFRFLHYNPKCYCCPNDSKIIDHIKPHKGDVSLFWNIANFLPLCKRCHDTITSKFDRHGQHMVEQKMKWIDNQRKQNGITVKVKLVVRKK